MNANSLRRFPAAAVMLALATLASHGAQPVIGAQLFQDTNARIDDLFQHRLNPPKPPGPTDNPFRARDTVDPLPVVPKNAGPAPGDTGPRETADEALLRQAFVNLNFGGMLQVGSTQMVVINKATYREGGLIAVRVQGASIYLRIISLTKDSIVIGLNEARLTLHF
ncbi:MAG: hypothetical protein JWM32_1329 [Verrucomicrobia bacterium]|nr:hypothetical protein [Verrucomicrobiota bacterium]